MSTTMESVSFNNCDSPNALSSYGSGNTLVRESLSFNERELDTTFSFKASAASDTEYRALDSLVSPRIGDMGEQASASVSENDLCSPYPKSGRHEAAVKLQKVYKSFRTRRRLADCAVVVEQRWWKLLDFAELKRSSISFFDIEKPETAISRWSRARMRAAKVGKGLSKDAKARKLALQHWLEAIDPRHRYGHNLQFYYVKWLQCECKQPFFYWLDIGGGKEVIHDRCPRSKLQQQCIKYLGPAERKAYEVVIENAKFIYKESGRLLNTTEGPKDAKWIFVLSTSKTLYVGQKSKGTFQHSSFLAGGATLSAGRLVVEDGTLKAVWPHSGHYLPTEENFQEFMLFLLEHGVDLTIVKKNPTEEEEEAINQKSDNELHTGETDVEYMAEENMVQSSVTSKLSRGLRAKITKLEIPTKDEVLDIFKREAIKHRCYMESPGSPSDEDYESAEESFFSEEDFMLPKMTLFDEDEGDDYAEPVPREKILKRIDSHKGTNSYQLAKQLSSRWTTGAGPRIGCMRDYPSELQLWALEHANLSPRDNSSPRAAIWYSPRVQLPTALTPVAVLGKKSASRSRLGLDQGERS